MCRKYQISFGPCHAFFPNIFYNKSISLCDFQLFRLARNRWNFSPTNETRFCYLRQIKAHCCGSSWIEAVCFKFYRFNITNHFHWYRFLDNCAVDAINFIEWHRPNAFEIMSSSHEALHLWYESNGFLIRHGIAAIDVGLVIPLLLPEHGMCRIHDSSGTFAIFAADEKERIHVFFFSLFLRSFALSHRNKNNGNAMPYNKSLE